MPRLILFDIDGTLVLTGGAGIRAMNRAAETIVGVRDLLDGIPVAGRTDWIIFRDALEKIGRDLDDDLFEQLRAAHVANLREEILQPGHGTKAVMPGVRALLEVLEPRDDVFLALLTGNFEDAARIKLEHFDLWRYFRCGAFGDDSEDRNALVPVAVDRARASGLADVAYQDVIVVGDTPHDIACAHAVGAVPVGVATGNYSVEQLRATGAPVVFPDLSDTVEFVRLLDEPPARR
jgi:phosphoglycolate phosphatase-like HAD superfamily hydrolase